MDIPYMWTFAAFNDRIDLQKVRQNFVSVNPINTDLFQSFGQLLSNTCHHQVGANVRTQVVVMENHFDVILWVDK